MAGSTSSVSGLVSGLDTASIISQLMQIEAQPQTNLKNQVAKYTTQLSSMQTVNAKLAAVATKSADLSQAAGWNVLKATTDNAKVTATATSTAAPATLSFTADKTATAAQATFTTARTLASTADANIAATLSVNGATVNFNTGDGKLQTIADTLNATGKVRASLVLAGTDTTTGTPIPTYQLHVEAAQTGAGGVTITDATTGGAFLGGPTAASTNGQDAQITVGGNILTSHTNTFTGVMPGVDVTLAAGASGATTLTVARDTQSLSDKVKAMVDSVNAALDDIDSLTSYDSSTNTAGILSGDSNLRAIRDQLLSTVSGGTGTASYASVGIQTDKTGRLTFDETKFQDAYNADPSGTAKFFTDQATYTPDAGTTGTVTLQGSSWRTVPGSYRVDAGALTIDGQPAKQTGSLLTGKDGTAVEDLTLDVNGGPVGTVVYSQGLAGIFESIGQRASDAADGTITAEINGTSSSIDGLNKDIADWDVRLSDKQTQLQQQYSALEVALGKLQDQASWLSGQIASLPTSGA